MLFLKKYHKLPFKILVLTLIIELTLCTLPITSIFTDTSKQTDSIIETSESTIQNTSNVKLELPPIGKLSETEFNITTNGDYFDGYNLFVLDKNNLVTHLQEVHLAVLDMKGNLISSMFLGSTQALVFSVAKFINSTTIVVGGIVRPFLWNFFENTTHNLMFAEHHDIEYISQTNTFLTLTREDKWVDGSLYAFDRIMEYTPEGENVWSLSAQSFVSQSQWCPYQDMLGEARSITHSNSLFYNPIDDTILLSCRNLNTIYKLNHTSKELIWSLGEYGDFDLYDINGNLKDSLWYHAHAFEFYDDNKIILFDNDFHNQTNYASKISRIVEITIDENKKTANETWTYEAPIELYTSIWGDADRLPNGNRLGTFGSMYHYLSSRNAIVIEINEQREIVWQMEFVENNVYNYGIYRTERFIPFPGIEKKEKVYSNSIEETKIQFETFSGYRTREDLLGNYQVYLNDSLIEEGSHIFKSYWRKTLLNINLENLASGFYNLTIILIDDSNHKAISTTIVEVKSFFVTRTGYNEIELGQADSILKWEGKAESPLLLNLTVNGFIFNSTTWYSSNVSLDLNILGLGEHKIEFLLYNNTLLLYNETFVAHVYLAEPPQVSTDFTEIIKSWGETIIIQWDLFDNTPKKWEIWLNGSFYTMEYWLVKSYVLNWKVPTLNEGSYNITLILFDYANFITISTIILTITSPSPPIIQYIASEQEYQFGVGNITISWLIHGGTYWYLWVDNNIYTQNLKTNNLVIFSSNNWDVGIWSPGNHNVTLQVIDSNEKESSSSVFVIVWLNKADPYADAIIYPLSELYDSGENALGEPDGDSCWIFEGYTLGYVTLDMGEQEEILNQNGDDFRIIASGGQYQIWVGNDLDVPFTYLGTATGNFSFNLNTISFDEVRYIRIQYTEGDFIYLDAIEAFYYRIPMWDSTPPIIHHLMNFEIRKNEKFAQLAWIAYDSNPLNFSIYKNNSIFKFGEWNGSTINCSIPLTKVEKIYVSLILFDQYGNSASSLVTITVLPSTTLIITLSTTIPSIVIISGVSFYFIKWKKIRKFPE